MNISAASAFRPESGALVDGCELRLGQDGGGEVSYRTRAARRGRGHARTALSLLADYAASIGVTVTGMARHGRVERGRRGRWVAWCYLICPGSVIFMKGCGVVKAS